jgi:Fe-S-cluster containining protein
MNQITKDLLAKICERCGGRCCFYAKPPLTEDRISILLEHGLSLDDVLFRDHRMLDCKSTGFCIGFKEGRCTVHPVRPETCVAIPFTFSICDGMLEIYLRKERLCDLVSFLKGHPDAYREQFELALQNIRRLIRSLPEEELASICREDMSNADKVAELPLAFALSREDLDLS